MKYSSQAQKEFLQRREYSAPIVARPVIDLDADIAAFLQRGGVIKIIAGFEQNTVGRMVCLRGYGDF